jgi:type I restriction enzyme, S subunit
MSWETARLGEVCTIEKGNVGIKKAIPGEYPLVVLGEERKSHNEFQFDEEAVIIPLVSSTGHGHKSMKRIFFQTGKFSVGSVLCAVIPKEKAQLLAEFLYLYLDFNKEKELVARMKGMANVTLPIREIAAVEIPLPPIHEQKQIIDRFQILKLMRAELDRQGKLIDELRTAIFREAIG